MQTRHAKAIVSSFMKIVGSMGDRGQPMQIFNKYAFVIDLALIILPIISQVNLLRLVR